MYKEKKLQEALQRALHTIYQQKIPLANLSIQPTPTHFIGTHTFTTFFLAKTLQQSPEIIANRLGTWLVTHTPFIDNYQVVKGYLNFQLTDSLWLESFDEVLQDNFKHNRSPQTILIEFSSPNTNKPLHLGHLRNNFLGDSNVRIQQALGHNVYKVSVINDRGIHICKSMLAYKKWGQGKTPSNTNTKGDHFVGGYYVLFEQAYQKQVKKLTLELGSKEKAKAQAPLLQEAQHMLERWEAGDNEVINLWKQMNQWTCEGFDMTYKKIGISFDKTYYESDIYLKGKHVVKEGLEKNIFFKKSNGSIWVDLQKEGLKEKLLIRANGTSVYITQDIGLIDERYSTHKFDKHIYVVGNEQNHHFKVLFSVLKKLQKPYINHLKHLSYGMVELPSGKMKSREGTAVDADKLIEDMLEIARKQTELQGKTQDFTVQELKKLFHTIALGALKYFLLKVSPQKNILFDPKKTINLQGDTALFIQYTYARIRSILRKAKKNYPINNLQQPIHPPLHPSEKEVVIHLKNFNHTLNQAAQTHNPSLLCQYAYKLAKSYSRFYTTLPILQEIDTHLQNKRIYLSYATAHLLHKTMSLLGITLPEKI